MQKKRSPFVVLGTIAVVVFVLVYIGVNLTTNVGKTQLQVNTEDAAKKLDKLYKNISVKFEEPVKGQIDLDPVDIGASLPDISKYPITEDNTTDSFAEIFFLQ